MWENSFTTMNHTNGTDGPPSMASIEKLYPAIIQCFVIILGGYIAGRGNIISSTQGKGIGTFVSNFCLPALLFKNMCILDFSVVDWYFLAGILISKTAVFLLVLIFTVLSKRPVNFGYAGLFGIFVTQSNDFALGYPILQALYEDDHPEYLKYIYLIAPISVVFLNPIGFAFLEIQKHRNQVHELEEFRESASSSKTSHRTCSSIITLLHVFKGIITNPIVFMTLIGILGNFIFQQKVPLILEDILTVLGDAFSASALFYLGLNMVGKIQGQLGLSLIVPLLLIGVKALLLPLVIWQVVGALERLSPHNSTDASELSMYGFLYGTFPTAPSVFLYASHYSIATDMVATGMVAGTFLSAPLMFVSAKMMTVVVISEMDYKSLLLEASFDTSIISLVCCVWVLIILLFSKRYKRLPHQFLVCLVLSHLTSCIGMILYKGQDCEMKTWLHYTQFTLILVGILATRCWTAVIAVTIYLLNCRSLCFVLRIRWWLYFIGFGLPVFVTGLLYLFGTHHMHDEIDPSFHYGVDQSVLSVALLFAASIVTITSLALKQRNSRVQKPSTRSPTPDIDEDTDIENQALRKTKKKKIKVKKALTCQDKGVSTNSPCTVQPKTLTKWTPSCEDCEQTCKSGIEDIVPFPSENDSLLSGSSGSSSSISSIGSYRRSLESKMCAYGTCSSEQRRVCMGKIRAYRASVLHVQKTEDDVKIAQPKRCQRDEYQTSRFIVLLVLMQFSMFIGLFLCAWRLFNSVISGIYVEIEFLDGVFNYGQGFFIFAIFGFDSRFIFMPFIKRWRRLVYGVEVVHLPDKSDLDEEVRLQCEQFVKYHKENCSTEIVKDVKCRFRDLKQVFTGVDMCDWLMEVGLVHDRGEAVSYGRTLLMGQVIAHVSKEHHFNDMPYYYCFVEEEEWQ